MNHNRQGQQYINLFSSLHTLDVFAICFPQSGYPSAVFISKTRMSRKAMNRMSIIVSKILFLKDKFIVFYSVRIYCENTGIIGNTYYNVNRQKSNKVRVYEYE